MVPNALQPYILYGSYNVLGHIGSTRLHNLLDDTIVGKSYVNIVTNVYAHVQNGNK